MKRIEFVRAIAILCAITSALLAVVFLWWHYRLGQVRYFDVDEFAHLRWSYLVATGERPYLDFLTFFPPGYFWFLAPIFWFAGGVAPILVSRMFTFGLFAGMCLMAALIFWEQRKSWGALVVAALLAFLPLPLDKYLENRPDNLATLLSLIGIYFQIRWMKRETARDGFLSGLAWFGSILVLTKMLPAVAGAFTVAVLSAVSRTQKFQVTQTVERIGPMILGFVVPGALFFAWLLSLGDFSQVFYSLTRLPFEANQISRWFIMMPDLFFYPNGIFYGENGWSRGLLTNHVVWMAGLAVGTYRLLLPYLASPERTSGREGLWSELLIASQFFLQVIFYVLIVPLKHTQYLIPIGVFVAWYAADGVYAAWVSMRRHVLGAATFGLLFFLGAMFFFGTFVRANTPKLTWTNSEALSVLAELFATVPRTEYLLDLDGRTMYYPSPYPACCIPFGQFAGFLSRPLPKLSEALERTKTKYIFQGELTRTNTLQWEDQVYVRDHYEPYKGMSVLLVRK